MPQSSSLYYAPEGIQASLGPSDVLSVTASLSSSAAAAVAAALHLAEACHSWPGRPVRLLGYTAWMMVLGVALVDAVAVVLGRGRMG